MFGAKWQCRQRVFLIKVNKTNHLYLDAVVFKAIGLWGRIFPIELKFGSVGSGGGREGGRKGGGREGEKNPRSKDQNQQQTQPPYMTADPEIEPGPHW